MKIITSGARRTKLIVWSLFILVICLLLAVIGLVVGGGRPGEKVAPETSLTERKLWESGEKAESTEESPSSLTHEKRLAPVPSAGSGPGRGLSDLGVKAIKTADVSIEIEKGTFERDYARLTGIAEGAGGFVSSSRTESTEGRITGGTITIRVPAASFSRVLDEVRKIGKIKSLSERAEDVTEEYVDLESRIRNLRTQLSVYLDLLSRARSVEESLAVQREITNVQSEIETLQGRKNYLDNRIDFGTINVTLMEKGTKIGEGWGIREAFSDALHGIVDGFNAIVRFVGRAFVYVIVISLLAFGVYYFLMRKKASRRKEERA